MTAARRDVYSPGDGGHFHCISRCVRRGFLCGFDRYVNKSYEHRKEWVRERLRKLLDIFAIECLAYAIMSNHLHTLLNIRPDLAAAWSSEEVFRRWRLLFPKQPRLGMNEEASHAADLADFIAQPDRVAQYRSRLSDLSWFNRCLNEDIARRANAEDDCSGRFWEGRFKSQRLIGIKAITSCSVYVDLNPVRAKIAATPEASDYTSIQDRIRTQQSQLPAARPGPKLIPHTTVSETMGEIEYIKLVDATARCVVAGKHSISKDLEPILERLGISEEGWLLNSNSQSRLFRRVIGEIDQIRQFAVSRSRRIFQGLGAAKRVFA